MAEVKNAFIKSKMNKDLDDRLIPSGEYRDALNVQVSKSEASDVGALENVLGNSFNVKTDFGTIVSAGGEVVGANLDGGQGYSIASNVTTTVSPSGGSGVLVNIEAENGGQITTYSLASVGYGYSVGDVITINGGAGNATLTVTSISSLKCIGFFVDDFKNNVYSFFTNYTDTSSSNDIVYSPNAKNFIFVHNLGTLDTRVLVRGAFLNFSTTSPIIGVSLLEELLFFTDNRNQPRKINVSLANPVANSIAPTYYVSEDQISVAKYNPYECIRVIKASAQAGALVRSTYLTTASSTKVLVVFDSTDISVGNGVTGTGVKTGTVVESIDGNNITVNKVQDLSINDTVEFVGLETSMYDASTSTLPNGGSALTSQSIVNLSTFNIDNVAGVITAGDTVSGAGVAAGTTVVNYTASTSTLEVSVGQNLRDNVVLTFGTLNPYYDSTFGGDPDFLEDKFVRFSYRFKFDDGEYSIFAPFTQPCFIPKQDGYFINDDEKQTFSSTVVQFMENKVTRINLQVPLPSSGSDLQSNTSPFKITAIDILYKESDGLAVQVVETIPINLAFSAATGDNNIYEYVYESTKPFKTLPSKELIRVYDKIPVRAFSQEVISNRVVYGNFQDKHTPPDFINYQVSVSEKYAKDDPFSSKVVVEYPSSTVKQNRNYQVGIVLSDKFGRQSSTILSNNDSPLSSMGFGSSTVFSSYQTEANTPPAVWAGDSLKVLFNDTIISNRNLLTGVPGLYNNDITSPLYNPLGWYSYKIVVQQKEQDYYNVYNAGAMKGSPTDVTKNLNTSYISLVNDNINKVPRDLSEVGPLQKQFRSSVRLIGRVENTEYETVAVGNQQFYPGRTTNTTSSIEDLRSIFDVDELINSHTTPISVTDPKSAYFPFYKKESDPLIAQITTTREFGLVNTPIGSGTSATYAAIKNLTIFETEPDLSRLDFYFETSTSGLISELNLAVAEDIGGAFGFNGFIFAQNEGMSLGTTVAGSFYPLDVAGVGITNSTLTLESVEDTTGNDRTGEWILVSLGDPGSGFESYDLNTAAYQYFGPNANANESYIFNFKIIDTTDPTTPSAPRYLSTTGSLANIAPSIPLGNQNISKAIGTTGTIVTLEGLNGANVLGGQERLNLVWSIVSGNVTNATYPNGIFTLNSNSGVLATQYNGASGLYTLVVKLTDAGGNTVQATITITFGNGPVPTQFIIPTTNPAGSGGSNGAMITYYFTDPDYSYWNGFYGLNANPHVLDAGYRQSDDSGTTPTDPAFPSGVNPTTGYVCPDPPKALADNFKWTRERVGDWIKGSDNAIFYVKIESSSYTTTPWQGYPYPLPSETSRTSASVEWRSISANVTAWRPAKDINGQIASFGQTILDANGTQGPARFVPSATFGLPPQYGGSYQMESSQIPGYTAPNYQYQVTAGYIYSTYGSRIFAFNGSQDGKTDGEYRITLGNMWDDTGTGWDPTPNPLYPPSYCTPNNNQSNGTTQTIQMGDASYGGPSGSGGYTYKVSLNNVDAICASTYTEGTFYAREFIAKYVTQLYTDIAMTTKATFASQVVRKFRIDAVNQEGYDNGQHLATFNTAGLRTTFSIGCLI